MTDRIRVEQVLLHNSEVKVSRSVYKSLSTYFALVQKQDAILLSWYSRSSNIRNRFFGFSLLFILIAYCRIYCVLRNRLFQFLIKWYLICETLLYCMQLFEQESG